MSERRKKLQNDFRVAVYVSNQAGSGWLPIGGQERHVYVDRVLSDVRNSDEAWRLGQTWRFI